MDLWSLFAVLSAGAALLGLLVYGALSLYDRGWSARSLAAEEAERRHVAESALLDATILSLRAELAAVRDASRDGQAASQGQLDTAARIAGAAPGDDRVYWSDADDPAPPRGREAGEASPPPGRA